MNKVDIIQKGKDGEEAFQDWLNSEDIAFLRIDQDLNTMSPVFKGEVKRPDYLMLLPSIGFIAIDVKHSTLKDNKFTLRIENEIDKSIAFEHHTRIYLWYAFKNSTDDGHKWFFISAHKAVAVGNKKYNRKDDVHYFEIELKHFKKVEKREHLSKLFNARIGAIGRFTRAVEYGLKPM